MIGQCLASHVNIFKNAWGSPNNVCVGEIGRWYAKKGSYLPIIFYIVDPYERSNHEAETNCGIARILGILLMNSWGTRRYVF